MIRKFFCIALLLTFSSAVALAQQSGKLKKARVIAIGAQNQASEYGSLVDLKNNRVYKIADAADHQSDIDLIYAYGKKTESILFTPRSTSIKSYGKNYREQIAEGWETKTNGFLAAVRDKKKAKKLFKALKTESDIEKLYESTIAESKELEDYKTTKYGPARSLTNLEVGDLVLFKSITKKTYAAGVVRHIEKSAKGYIEINFKVAE